MFKELKELVSKSGDEIFNTKFQIKKDAKIREYQEQKIYDLGKVNNDLIQENEELKESLDEL